MRQFSYYVNQFRVVDGDTIQATLDMGFHLSGDWAVRFYGIDAPEVHGPTRKYGLHVADVVDKWMRAAHIDGEMKIRSVSVDEKYGRLLGIALNSSGESLADYLLLNRLVLPYDGKTKQIWTATALADLEISATAILKPS